MDPFRGIQFCANVAGIEEPKITSNAVHVFIAIACLFIRSVVRENVDDVAILAEQYSTNKV